MRPSFDVWEERLARAAWSRIVEGGDDRAGRWIREVGAQESLARLYFWAERELGPAPADVPDGLVDDHDGASALAAARRALARWAVRLEHLDPRRELGVLSRLGGAFLIPSDDAWPRALDDLGEIAPMGLWVRGNPSMLEGTQHSPDSGVSVSSRSVALVGARAASEYGERLASELASELADRRFAVISGGAFGIDAAAHRGALAAGGLTIAVLAGGVDKLYPRAHEALLRRVCEVGLVVSECPPGSAPLKSRFLMRNRLIAALAGCTVVVEAAWRSGALSTARWAERLLRPVGAVPGPVTSAVSVGPHRLIRDGAAICVTDAAEIAELAGAMGHDALVGRDALVGHNALVPQGDRDQPAGHGRAALMLETLEVNDRLVLDSLPSRSWAEVGSLCRVAGLSVPEVMASLGRLTLLGLANQSGDRWTLRR